MAIIINFDTVKSVLKAIFLYSLGFLVLCALVYWFWKHPLYNPVGVEVTAPTDIKIEIVFKNVQLKARKNGLKSWFSDCKRVEVEKGTSMVYFKDKPRGEFYGLSDNNSKVGGSYKWLSDLVEYNTDTDNFTFKGNVNITTDKKDVIETDELNWDNQEQIIKTEKKVKIVGKDKTISSDNFSARIRENLYELKGNVSVVTKDKTITSDNLNVNVNDDIYDLQGNVKIISKDKTITANSLTINQKDGFYNFQGNVSIVTKDKTITSDNLAVNEKQGVSDFQTNVRIVSKDRTITSDSLTVMNLQELYNFQGNVRMLGKDKTITSDNVVINWRTGSYDLQGNVEIDSDITNGFAL